MPVNDPSQSAGATVVATPTGNWTNALWAAVVLAGIGAPVTQNNITNMLHWMAAEEPPSNWYNRNNPLNTSVNTGAGDGTGSAPDLLTGAQDTISTINQQNMAAIKSALVQNSSLDVFAAAVSGSPWASGHYGGPSGITGTTAATVDSGIAAPAGIASAVGVTQAQLTSILGDIGNALNPLGPVSSAASALGEFSTIATKLSSYQFWLRVGEFTLGLGLLVGGLALFVATSKEGEKAIGTAADVAPLLAA